MVLTSLIKMLPCSGSSLIFSIRLNSSMLKYDLIDAGLELAECAGWAEPLELSSAEGEMGFGSCTNKNRSWVSALMSLERGSFEVLLLNSDNSLCAFVLKGLTNVLQPRWSCCGREMCLEKPLLSLGPSLVRRWILVRVDLCREELVNVFRAEHPYLALFRN